MSEPTYNKGLADFLVKVGNTYVKKNLRSTAEAILVKDGVHTVQDHIDDASIHTPAEQIMLKKDYNVGSATVGDVKGLATLDTNGLIPTSQIPATFKEIEVVTNIESRNALTNNFVGRQCYVIDAKDDESVTSGGATYIVVSVSDGNTTWQKISEAESMDIVAAIASNSVTGAVRVASATEVEAGTDTVTVGTDQIPYVVTPSQLKKVKDTLASETATGSVELATDAEALAGQGTATVSGAPLVVTAKGLKYTLDNRPATSDTTGLVKLASATDLADKGSIAAATTTPTVKDVSTIISKYPATTTEAGIVRLATDAEAAYNVENPSSEIAVTPKQLQAVYNESISVSARRLASEDSNGTVELATIEETIKGTGTPSVSGAPLVPTIQGVAAAIDNAHWVNLNAEGLGTPASTTSFTTSSNVFSVGQNIRVNQANGNVECKVTSVVDNAGTYTVTISGGTLVTGQAISGVYESKFAENAEVAVGTTAQPPADFTGLYYIQLIAD